MPSGLKLSRNAIFAEWPEKDIRLYRGNGSHAYYYFSGVDGSGLPSLYVYRLDPEDVEMVLDHVRRHLQH